MKTNYINSKLTPPEYMPTKAELQNEDFEQNAIKYVRENYQPNEIFDLYNHEMAAALPFAEYLSYHYATVRTSEGFRHKARGKYFTTEQIWNEYNTLPKK